MNSLAQYQLTRHDMRPGDVVAFRGTGFISGAIRFFTNSPVSHVGVVFESKDEAGERRVVIAESTTLNDKQGVQINYLSDRLRGYPGVAWWLPLSDHSRAALDVDEMHRFLVAQQGDGYDYRGIAAFLARPIPGLGMLLHHGDLQRWFCSELVVEAFERGGLLRGVEADECNPQWLCSCAIYERCVQLIGAPAEIPRFNSL